jgi:hypothetical protein
MVKHLIRTTYKIDIEVHLLHEQNYGMDFRHDKH